MQLFDVSSFFSIVQEIQSVEYQWAYLATDLVAYFCQTDDPEKLLAELDEQRDLLDLCDTSIRLVSQSGGTEDEEVVELVVHEDSLLGFVSCLPGSLATWFVRVYPGYTRGRSTRRHYTGPCCDACETRGKKCREAREALSLGRSEVAEMIGVGRTRLGYFEKRGLDQDADLIESAIKAVLQLSLHEQLQNDPESERLKDAAAILKTLGHSRDCECVRSRSMSKGDAPAEDRPLDF
jgi:hypothetical protein